MISRALITGVCGQDGYYLAPILAAQGVEVHGSTRGGGIAPDGVSTLHTHSFDAIEPTAALLANIQPDAVIHLGGQSDVGASFKNPAKTFAANGGSTSTLLEACTRQDTPPRFIYASTCQIFAGRNEVAITEQSTRSAENPYAISKAYGHDLTAIYRTQRGLRASNAILFNHESPQRPDRFVTRKITQQMARIAGGASEPLAIGSLDAARDWSHARDIARAIALMANAEHGDDYVLASGQARTVRDFIEAAAQAAGFRVRWHGSGVEEYATRDDSDTVVVRVDPVWFRPVEYACIVGDATKAKTRLNWTPETSFDALVREMVEADTARIREPSA